MRAIPVSLFVILFAGCSGQGGPVDAGPDADGQEVDGSDGADSQDADGGDDGDGHWTGFELVVPEDTWLCTTFYPVVGDWLQGMLEVKARVRLRPGRYELPRDALDVPAELIRSYEVYPGVEAWPDGPGAFHRTLRGEADGGVYRYAFEQAFQGPSERFAFVLGAEFEVRDGHPLAPVLTLTDEVLFGDLGYDGLSGFSWNQMPLLSCRRDLLTPFERDLRVEGGDRLQIFQRGRQEFFEWPPPGGMVYVGEIERAVWTRGAGSREQTDFFRLASIVNHHGCCPGYLVLLDEPLDGVHGLMIDEFSYGFVLHYLDAAGASFGSSPYADAR
jgi:hypothetical protein